ncbi:MAG TPA: translation initiation factor IF-2 [Opitutales bacterium]|nr:translation initiation factor IF-2 [Opitutales bacterium]
MSVRIHQLSKDIGMENKELIALLRSRGFEVKSASSTIDNINADAIREEFTKPAEEAAPEPEPEAEKPAAPQIPAGAFVKSAEDIQREREAKAAAEKEEAEAGKPEKPAEAEASKPEEPSAKPETPPAPPAPRTPPTPPKPPAPPAAGPPKPPSPPAAPTPPKPPAAAQADEPKKDSEAEESPESADEIKTIHLKPPIVVRDFAAEIGLKPFKLISELMEMGIFASMNQSIEEDVAKNLAERHGCILEIHHRGEGGDQGSAKPKEEKPADDDPRFMEPRPPVVCILGHVDHGKTTLLDTIRKANVTAGEAGGITQHLGAYQIEHKGQKISFVDTPGHAAFSKMRSRGANVTDVAVLVIAADDAFKPQTDEALKFAKEANNAIVVAINKIDSKGANADRVKQQMQEKGIAPEEWGGETVTVEVSALNGTNIDELLDMILLQAEVLELKANPKCPASGTVVESQVELGRGATATVIVERGTLKQGDALLCGEVYCRVKSLTDADGNMLKSVPPGTPARVMGWSDVPSSGAKFSTEKNEKAAKRAAEEAVQKRKLATAAENAEKSGEGGAATVEDLFAAIESQQKKCLRVIVKSDVHGSTEALVTALEEIRSDKVDLEVISRGVGHITKNDVTLASAGGATIVGFNVKLDNGVQSLAKHHEVRIVQHDIIYELIDRVEESMAELLDAEYIETKSGVAEVRQVFGVGKGRNVAGCMIIEGTIKRNGIARLMRDGELVHEGKVDTLKRFKEDVKEVRAGYECGINISEFNDYQEGDTIECFEVEEQRPSL